LARLLSRPDNLLAVAETNVIDSGRDIESDIELVVITTCGQCGRQRDQQDTTLDLSAESLRHENAADDVAL
jgi:hypothetical protein